tara:strand:+ start:72 stop:569 length:498 start_codon:yes stop_codon:yes gene_type:complete
MKLKILLVSIILIGCTNDKDITSFNQMGEKIFQIIDNIEKSSYNEFRQNFLSRKELTNILNNEFHKDENKNKFQTQLINMSDEEYDYGLKIDIENYQEIKEYLTSMKNKGRFQFIDFDVKLDDELKNLYNGELKWKIISETDNKEKKGFFIFYIHDEVFYLLGID